MELMAHGTKAEAGICGSLWSWCDRGQWWSQREGGVKGKEGRGVTESQDPHGGTRVTLDQGGDRGDEGARRNWWDDGPQWR